MATPRQQAEQYADDLGNSREAAHVRQVIARWPKRPPPSFMRLPEVQNVVAMLSAPRSGEYVAVNLDENNRHTREAWAKRHPDEPQRPFGWGVCRHGHGLLDHGAHHGVVLTEAWARAWADELNAESAS